MTTALRRFTTPPAEAPRRAAVGLLLLPSVVLLASVAAVALRPDRAYGAVEQALVLVVALLPLLTTGLLRLLRRQWDAVLGSAVWMLCALGLYTVARVEPDLFGRQLTWTIVGWAALLVTILTPGVVERLRRYKYTWLFAGLTLAAATLVFGRDLNGSGIRLWLQVGPIVVQPSEVLKVLLVVYMAAYLDERHGLLSAVSLRWGPLLAPPLPYLLPLLAMLGLSLLVLVVQHDLGPALLYFGTFLAMVYIATGRRSLYLSGLGLFLIGGALAYLWSGHVRARVALWLDPWSDPQGLGYQSIQALGGLAFGGVAGRGPGYGYPGLIPAGHTDYALAVIGEEWGLIGTLAVVLLYAVVTVRSLHLAARLHSDRFAQLLAAGLGVSLGLQSLIILSGTLRLVPLTGITSPFLSYGGSSLVMGFVMIGLLARLAHEGGVALTANQPGARP